MADEKSVDGCWQYNKDTRGFVEAVEARHDKDLREIKDDLKTIVERLQNRLPPWAMFFISFLTLLVGGLLSKVVW